MDSEIQSELELQRRKLVKALQQGQQVQNLQAAPEWEFFEAWIRASRDKLITRLTGEGFINDHNGYLFTVAAIRSFDTILTGVKQFQKAFDSAARKINELNELERGNGQ